MYLYFLEDQILLVDALGQRALSKITSIKRKLNSFQYSNVFFRFLNISVVNIYKTAQKKKKSQKMRDTSLNGLRNQVILFYSACLYKQLFKRNEVLLLLNKKIILKPMFSPNLFHKMMILLRLVCKFSHWTQDDKKQLKLLCF